MDRARGLPPAREGADRLVAGPGIHRRGWIAAPADPRLRDRLLRPAAPKGQGLHGARDGARLSAGARLRAPLRPRTLREARLERAPRRARLQATRGAAARCGAAVRRDRRARSVRRPGSRATHASVGRMRARRPPASPGGTTLRELVRPDIPRRRRREALRLRPRRSGQRAVSRCAPPQAQRSTVRRRTLCIPRRRLRASRRPPQAALGGPIDGPHVLSAGSNNRLCSRIA